MTQWASEVINFNPSIIDESERIIEGVASAPVYDRQNELITREAIEKALPEFMVLPVLTVQHKEFVAGKVMKAWFDESNKLHINCKLKPTRDVDGVWELIKSGILNSFSISGRRYNTSCSSDGRPCVTTDISLNAITICGDNRVNPEAQFTIAKALGCEIVMPEDENTTPIEKAKQEEPSFTKAELVSAIVEELKSQGLFIKSEEDKKEEKEEDKKEDDVKKSLEDITKSLSDMRGMFESLSKKVENIEDQPLQKSLGFQVIGDKIVPVDLTKVDMDMKKSTNDSSYMDEFVKMRLNK